MRYIDSSEAYVSVFPQMKSREVLKEASPLEEAPSNKIEKSLSTKKKNLFFRFPNFFRKK